MPDIIYIGGEMICAYCNKEKSRTKEHIIPNGVLELFPECDYSIREDKAFKADLIINDVCSECNNDKLGILDAYGKKLIDEYFVKEYQRDEKLTFDYYYELLSRWLLKICYNYSRSHKLDVNWFIRNISYLLEGSDTNARFSVFMGLHVNTSPMPEFVFGNVKMNINHDPIISDTGFLIPIDELNGLYKPNDNHKALKFKEAEATYKIRFGSAQFVIYLWKSDVEDEQIRILNGLFDHLFRHNQITEDNVLTIERCTEPGTVHIPPIVVSDLAISIGDSANGFVRTDIPAEQVHRIFGSDQWEAHVREIRKEHEVQRQMERDRKKSKKES